MLAGRVERPIVAPTGESLDEWTNEAYPLQARRFMPVTLMTVGKSSIFYGSLSTARLTPAFFLPSTAGEPALLYHYFEYDQTYRFSLTHADSKSGALLASPDRQYAPCRPALLSFPTFA